MNCVVTLSAAGALLVPSSLALIMASFERAAEGDAAATFDIVYAWLFWSLKADVSMQRILQSVAAGLLGEASYSGEGGTATLGHLEVLDLTRLDSDFVFVSLEQPEYDELAAVDELISLRPTSGKWKGILDMRGISTNRLPTANFALMGARKPCGCSSGSADRWSRNTGHRSSIRHLLLVPYIRIECARRH